MDDTNWKHHNNNVGRGKGISTFYSAEFEVEKSITQEYYQITKIISNSLDIVNVYRSSGTDDTSFLKDLTRLLNSEKHTLIFGDFNICYRSDENHGVFQTLRNLGYKQLVKYATHIEGRLLDQIFCFCPDVEITYEVKQQAQYYLDHDLISIVETKQSE